jgi:SAM-dependent methyltransferase
MAFDNPRDTWNRRFARSGYLFGTEPNAWLRRHQALFAVGQRALCVADGEGRNSVWLARLGLQVRAFDISDLAVDKARRLATEAGVNLQRVRASVEEFDWRKNEFDFVVAIFVQFADPQERAQLFADMIAALKPGGLLLVQGYGPRQIEFATGGPGKLSHLYTVELMRELTAGMQILELQRYEDVLAEGSQHLGRSDLIGLVARKHEAPLS